VAATGTTMPLETTIKSLLKTEKARCSYMWTTPYATIKKS